MLVLLRPMRNLASSQDSKRTRPGSPCCLPALAALFHTSKRSTEPLGSVITVVGSSRGVAYGLTENSYGLLYPFALASFCT